MGSTFHVEHFGCRAARADGEAIGDRLRAAGHCMQQLRLRRKSALAMRTGVFGFTRLAQDDAAAIRARDGALDSAGT